MAYIVLVLLTLISCTLFEFSKVPKTLKELLNAYKVQFQLMGNKELSDSEKQQKLMQLVGNQLRLLAKLILGMVLFVTPFLSLYLLKELDASLHPEILVSWWGLLIPIVTVFLYLGLKRLYGNVFNNR